MDSRRALTVAVLATVVSAGLAGCGVAIPTDPDGTLDRIRSTGELVAGATPAGAALVIDGSEPEGPLVDLVEEFAEAQGARVTWRIGGEETLVDALETGAVDVVVGGMTTATPWSDRVSVSRGFDGVEGAGDRSLVFLVPLGENALQSAFEAALDEALER